MKCKLLLALSMEHEDPDKVYELKIPYGSYIEFSKYVKTLHAAGTDVPNVMTKITRIENPDGPGGLYTFERGDDYEGSVSGDEEAEAEEVELTAAESAALDSLKAKIKKLGDPMPVEFAAGMLTKTASVKGISNERALAVVNTIAVDGFIE
ncbi:hypothetical protein [Methanolobus sp. WCC5]|uniref:hypothetical protein n=1 Tax=Methanolobus sp. WCC5 TaxID=3125785 RepID=UPI003244130C